LRSDSITMPQPISSASGIPSGSMDYSQAIQGDGRRSGSVIFTAVVAPDKPVVTSDRDIFLMKATALPAICRLTTVQMLKVQFHQARIVEISREIGHRRTYG